MLVTLLGTGCPQVHRHRFGPASLVRAGGASFLIDCGSGVTQRMASTGVSGAGLDALLITHLHSDHVVDLYQLIISSWHQGRDRPQRIFGPAGTRDFALALMEVWRKERELRIAWECRPSTAGLELEIIEFAEGVIWQQDGIRISAFEVDHGPVKPAFGFLFESAGCRVAFSGDTTVCDKLVSAARDVDLLVHECFIHGEMAARRGLPSEQGLANVASYHTLSSEVGKVASRARARALLLNHLVPVEFDRDALLGEVVADFAGPVVIGEDLLTIDVPHRALGYGGLRLGLGRSG
jgi:ribonuclease BN (tRNA processing enzyme)